MSIFIYYIYYWYLSYHYRPKERESYFLQAKPYTILPFQPETVLSSWEGMGFNELAKYLVFTGDGQTTGSEEDALRYAEEFYEASQIGGGAPISIPAVYINDAALFFNDEDDTTDIDSKPDLFRCAKSTRSMMESDENTAAIVSNDTDTSASDDIGSSSESSSTAIACRRLPKFWPLWVLLHFCNAVCYEKKIERRKELIIDTNWKIGIKRRRKKTHQNRTCNSLSPFTGSYINSYVITIE